MSRKNTENSYQVSKMTDIHGGKEMTGNVGQTILREATFKPVQRIQYRERWSIVDVYVQQGRLMLFFDDC